MEITELSQAEVLALVILAKHLVHADGTVSGSEIKDLLSLSEAIGPQRFAMALASSKDKYKSRRQAMTMAEVIQRRESRELVYTLLEELAKGDFMSRSEDDILAELRLRWGIQLR